MSFINETINKLKLMLPADKGSLGEDLMTWYELFHVKGGEQALELVAEQALLPTLEAVKITVCGLLEAC